MPNVFDRATHFAMRLRGYRRHRVPTSVGQMQALSWDGAGPLAPLTLVHGWASAGVHHVMSARQFRNHSKRLILPDLPGHGFSEGPARLTPEATAIGLQQTLDALLDEPTVLMGSSLGALAAVRYALARPEAVKALILTAPFGGPLSPEELQHLVQTVRARTLGDTKRFLDRLSVRPQARNWLFAPEMWRILNRPTLQSLLDAAASTPLLTRDEVDSLQVPVTVIWGFHERLLPPSQLEFWRQAPTSEVIRLSRSGHSPSIDEPRLFSRIVLNRLRLAS